MDTCFNVIDWTPRPLEFFRFRYVSLMEVSSMFYIYRNRVLTWYGRVTLFATIVEYIVVIILDFIIIEVESKKLQRSTCDCAWYWSNCYSINFPSQVDAVFISKEFGDFGLQQFEFEPCLLGGKLPLTCGWNSSL